MTLNARKRAFADALAEGKSQRQSALAAGYANNNQALDKTGGRLVRDPDVIAYLGRAHGVTTSELPQIDGGRTITDPPPPKVAVEPPPKVTESPKQQKVTLEPLPTKVTAEPAPRHDGDSWIEDPLEYLKRVMNDPIEDPKLRADAAKTLMPFVHARKGEVGKKEQKQEAAEQAGTGRFGLRAVK